MAFIEPSSNGQRWKACFAGSKSTSYCLFLRRKENDVFTPGLFRLARGETIYSGGFDAYENLAVKIRLSS
jgi:hypothetical protein